MRPLRPLKSYPRRDRVAGATIVAEERDPEHMYTEYWRLKEKPFENTLDMRFAFMTPQHKEGLARLLYTVEERKCGAILTGDYGTGKSFLRQAFLGKLSRIGSFVVASVDNPLGGIEAVLTDIYCQIVEKPAAFTSFGAALREMREALLARNARGFHSLVLIEESQLIPDIQMLEQLRLMMDLQDGEGRPLISVLFFGHLDLLRVLGQCRALSQRIPNRWTLEPLSVAQTRDYITHRLSIAGGNGWIFDDDAVLAIHEHTGGLVRLVNNIGDLSLYLGMSEEVVRVDASIVNRIVKDWELSQPLKVEGSP
jgi:general secretion pathway protein A